MCWVRVLVQSKIPPPGEGGGTWVNFGWSVRDPLPIIVYSVTNYRPHLSHFWANMWFAESLSIFSSFLILYMLHPEGSNFFSGNHGSVGGLWCVV